MAATDYSRGGFSALIRQGAMILALLTFTWCLAMDVSTFESIFRSLVVYLAINIIGLIAKSSLARLTAEAPAQVVRSTDEMDEVTG
jgi:hypothetical protein